ALLPSYSREREAEADAFSAELMLKLGRDPRALGNYLVRHAGAAPSKVEMLFKDHPEQHARAAAIEAMASAAPNRDGAATPALLTTAEWAALKQICQAAPASKRRAPPEVQRQPSGDALERSRLSERD